MGGFLDKAVSATTRRVRLMKLTLGRGVVGRGRRGEFINAVKTGAPRPGCPAIIVEYKRCAPGRVVSNIEPWEYIRATRGYAAAYSVLVEPYWFCGSSLLVREFSREKPVLYKDFVIDEIQLRDAVAHGASAVLLILEALGWSRLDRLFSTARGLGLDALIETSDPVESIELANSYDEALIGINSRDLRTLRLDVSRMVKGVELFRSRAPSRALVVAESGVEDPRVYAEVARAGADAVLVGTAVMKNPGVLAEFLNALPRGPA